MYINMKSKIVHLFPIFLFLATFFFVPVAELSYLRLIPGDVGDARLNNFFLENIYQFFFGNADSLWHLNFFWPFPYVLGFSENHFGTFMPYMFFRLLGNKMDTSFQLWFYFGYFVNFAASYYALRKFNGSIIASSIGALIFTFALPTSAHAGHAQLHYRFGIPLSLLYFSQFLSTRSWNFLIYAGAWLVWQFYSSIYMGFFALFFIAAMFCTFLFVVYLDKFKSYKLYLCEFKNDWLYKSFSDKLIYTLYIFFLVSLLILLFYPYIQVQSLHGVKRDWAEIATMLPRPQSYFLSDSSYIWSNPNSKLFLSIPVRHEHQMFFGLAPLLLAFFGFMIGGKKCDRINSILMSGIIFITIISTIYIGKYSFWYILHQLPLFSAIRAVVRIDQALLFPVAYFTVIAIDRILNISQFGLKIIFSMILPFTIFELSMTDISSSTKLDWRERITKIRELIYISSQNNGIVFYAQNEIKSLYADEIDIMLLSQEKGFKTLNGYSGVLPHGYQAFYGKDCSELPRRVLYYMNIVNRKDDVQFYRETISKIIPVGFNNCNPDWWQNPPIISSAERLYTSNEIKSLSYSGGNLLFLNGSQVINFKVVNNSSVLFSRDSKLKKPLRLAWRMIDAAGAPLSSWDDNRKELPFDITALGSVEVFIPLGDKLNPNAKYIQISLVQEHVFWAHNVGVEPLSIKIKE